MGNHPKHVSGVRGDTFNMGAKSPKSHRAVYKVEQRASFPLPPHQAGTACEGPHQTFVLQYLDLELPQMQI